jgi:hypothetical protein
MRAIWSPTLDQYIEAMELAQSRGKKAGDDFSKEFFEVMEKYKIKPSGFTELNRDELINEMTSHGQTVAEMETKDNKTKLKIYKKREE